MGDDDRLTAARVAARLGVKKPTWWAWVQRGQAPPPDGADEFSGWAYWHPSTIDEWESERPRGRRRQAA